MRTKKGHDDTTMAAPLKFRSEVIGVKTVTHDTRCIAFSVPKNFSFAAGQFIMMVMEKEGKETRRPYSIASSPDRKGLIELAVKEVEGGTVSTYFSSLKKGDHARFIGPFGKLNAHDCNKGIAFIATGIGITPFRSMITYLLEHGCMSRLFLFLSVKHENEFLFEDEWRGLEQKHQNFRHFVSVTRPSKKYKGDTGRVHALLQKRLPHGFDGDFYVCGVPPMVDECRQNLLAQGVSKERIFVEKFG